jgi:itaconyl-CoA hydratase
MRLTRPDSYFEDFAAGTTYEHSRGRTVMEQENTLFTHLTLNTASTHFNRHLMATYMDGRFRDRLVNGGVTLSIVIGLTSEDLSENALTDVGLTKVRMHNPVFPGDTLYARSEILEVGPAPDRDDVGFVRYAFRGYNDAGQQVTEGERSILIKRRSHWAERDAAGPGHG